MKSSPQPDSVAPPADLRLTDRRLHTLLRPLRRLDNRTSFRYLLVDYTILAGTLAGTITVCHCHRAWGLHSTCLIPLVAAAFLIIGAVQHRLAALVHEGAHFILFKNRYLNEIVSDVCCAFPLFSTTAFYRLGHVGHHVHVNDWQRDPELLNLGRARGMDRFPMSRTDFCLHFASRIFWPPSLWRYLWKTAYQSVFGETKHAYQQTAGPTPPRLGPLRVTSLLGTLYLIVMIGSLGWLSHHGTAQQLLFTGLGLWLLSAASIFVIPTSWFFQTPFPGPYSPKVGSILRLGFITALDLTFAYSRLATGVEWGIYFYLLWVGPLATTFAYYMLIRDLAGHANTDQGRLTNSRAVYCHPLIQWALFVHGQGLHATHHLFQAVPQYHLHRAHRLMQQHCSEYAEHVEECHGLFANNTGQPTLIEAISARPRRQRLAA